MCAGGVPKQQIRCRGGTYHGGAKWRPEEALSTSTQTQEILYTSTLHIYRRTGEAILIYSLGFRTSTFSNTKLSHLIVHIWYVFYLWWESYTKRSIYLTLVLIDISNIYAMCKILFQTIFLNKWKVNVFCGNVIPIVLVCFFCPRHDSKT